MDALCDSGLKLHIPYSHFRSGSLLLKLRKSLLSIKCTNCLNFNKTNYVHFTTKRNMSVNLKIGLTIILLPTAPTQNSWG